MSYVGCARRAAVANDSSGFVVEGTVLVDSLSLSVDFDLIPASISLVSCPYDRSAQQIEIER